MTGPPALRVAGLAVSRPAGAWGSSRLPVLLDLSVTAHAGQAVVVLGESGSGKTTLIRTVMGLTRPDRGVVEVDRGRVGWVPQDPRGAFDPRWPLGRSVAEPLSAAGIHGAEVEDRLRQAVAEVGLSPTLLASLPDELSGGELQRLAVARALIRRPALLVADEPFSAVDVVQRAALVSLMQHLQRAHGLTVLLVTHDVRLAHALADRVVVLAAGRVVEEGAAAAVLGRPAHPVTASLVAAGLGREPPEGGVGGEPPPAAWSPPGCPQRLRCRRAGPECASTLPSLSVLADGHAVACHHPLNQGGTG